MPAPPIAMKWSRRPFISAISGRLLHLAGDPLGRVRLREPSRGAPHLPQASLVGEKAGDGLAEALGCQLVVGNHERRPSARHPAGMRRLAIAAGLRTRAPARG